METQTQAEIILREAGYETWPWSGGPVPVVCFENEALMGFVHIFSTGVAILDGWRQAQEVALARHGAVLRAAGGKSWNVYSVFLTSDDVPPGLGRRIERIEEDFTLARKIARSGVTTAGDVGRALLPLLPIQSQPVIASADYIERLRSRLTDVPATAVVAFLGSTTGPDVARILAEVP